MNKKAIIVVLVGLLVGVGGYFAFFYEPCKEPSELMVQMTQLGCAMAIITEDLRVGVCRELGREDNCEFVEEDKTAISNFINKTINACTKKELKAKNFCTDKVQDLNGSYE